MSSVKQYDLVIVDDNEQGSRQVFSLLSGKNQIGTNIKCTTQVDFDLIKPQHFEILVYRSGKLTLIPLTSGVQTKSSKSRNEVELEANQCYEISEKEKFYVENTYACFIEEHVVKKSKEVASNTKKLSLWNPLSLNKKANGKRKQSERRGTSEESNTSTFEPNPTKILQQKTRQKQKTQSLQQLSSEEEKEQSIEKIQVYEKLNASFAENKREQQFKVMLSNCSINEDEKKVMEQLGVIFVDNPDQPFDILVMDSFCRRAKLLIALNVKACIVNKNWILDCVDDIELITDLKEYFLEVNEPDVKKYGSFDLDSVQKISLAHPDKYIFSDMAFLIQPTYKYLKGEELNQIVTSGKGIVLSSIDKIMIKKFVQVYHIIEKDEVIEKKNTQLKGVQYVDPEFVLLSSLKQDLQRQYIYK